MRTFAGIEEAFAKWDRAEVVLLPVPYDGTSTYGKGANKGPEAILDAAENMELYDIETDSEVYRKGIFIAKAVEEESSPEAMVEAVKHATTFFLDEGKFFTMLGGEHSVTIGAIKAFRERYENLTVLQLDAHSDLRPEYKGSACNHACALHEASKTCNLIQKARRAKGS